MSRDAGILSMFTYVQELEIKKFAKKQTKAKQQTLGMVSISLKGAHRVWGRKRLLT